MTRQQIIDAAEQINNAIDISWHFIFDGDNPRQDDATGLPESV